MASPTSSGLSAVPARLALGYGVVAGLWILLSDRLILAPGWPPWVHTAKGWLFVVATAAGMYLVLRRLVHHVLRLQGELERRATLLEIRVEERTRELTASQQELDALVYAASHDLRAPLRSVAGFAQALREDFGTELGVDGNGHLTRIISAADRMDRIVVDLRDYNHLARTALPMEPVSLEELMEANRALFTPQLARSGGHIEVTPPLPPVLAHSETLNRVIMNLFDNAVKFVDGGIPPRVRVRAERRQDRVRIWVEDEGIGIPADRLAQVFEPFERLHPSSTYPGNGFGLAVVRRGIERMAGTVGAESEVGKGSRFWFELPAAAQAGP